MTIKKGKYEWFCFLSKVIFIFLAMITILIVNSGCTCSRKNENEMNYSETASRLYQTIKTINGDPIYKVTIWCPNSKPQVYNTIWWKILNDHVYLYEYETGTYINTSCPFFIQNVRQKKSGEVLLLPNNKEKSDLNSFSSKDEGDQKSDSNKTGIVINNNVAIQNK